MEPGAAVPLTPAIVDAACDLVDMMMSLHDELACRRGSPDAEPAGR